MINIRDVQRVFFLGLSGISLTLLHYATAPDMYCYPVKLQKDFIAPLNHKLEINYTIFTELDNIITFQTQQAIWILPPLFAITVATLLTNNFIATKNVIFYYFSLSIVITFAGIALCANYLILLYLCLEVVTFALVFHIIYCGEQPERIRAAIFMAIYSICASSLVFLYIMYHGSLSEMTASTLLVIAFLIKVPIFPFHAWLIEVHGYASTLTSVVLASLVIKVPLSALVRFNILVIEQNLWLPLIHVLVFFSVFAVSLSCLTYTHVKHLCAAMSIIHMSILLLIIFTQHGDNTIILFGAGIHSFTSAATFCLVQIFYQHVQDYNINIIVKHIHQSKIRLLATIIIGMNVAFPPTASYLLEISILYHCMPNLMSVFLVLSSSLCTTFVFLYFWARLMADFGEYRIRTPDISRLNFYIGSAYCVFFLFLLVDFPKLLLSV